FGLVRESEPMERFVEPETTRVAGEHAARAVAAVRGRRQTHDQEARRRIAEPRHRLAPVRLVTELALLLACDALAVLAQARAELAGDDRAPDRLEGGCVLSEAHSGTLGCRW